MSVDILAIASQAKQAKENDPTVINATLGTFYNEKKEMVIPFVKESYLKLKPENLFPYGSTDGGKIFKENILDWVFWQNKETITNRFMPNVIATPGGSGALSIIFNTYANPNDKVLISNIKWRYDYFTDAAKLKIETYNLFKDQAFDLKDFKQKLNNLSRTQKNIIVVINDPCHNPTGYQLSNIEYQSIIETLNQYTNNTIQLVLDIAYFDYDPEGFLETRNKFLLLKQTKPHITNLIAFSASKSFSIYGIRLGALIGLFNTKEQETFFNQKAYKDALGKWSTPPSVGIELFNEILKDKEAYQKELTKITNQLTKRGERFLTLSKKYNLKHYPYKGGFFILIPSDHPLRDYQRLIVEEKLYVVPMQEGLRVALCSVSLDEIEPIILKLIKIV